MGSIVVRDLLPVGLYPSYLMGSIVVRDLLLVSWLLLVLSMSTSISSSLSIPPFQVTWSRDCTSR